MSGWLIRYRGYLVDSYVCVWRVGLLQFIFQFQGKGFLGFAFRWFTTGYVGAMVNIYFSCLLQGKKLWDDLIMSKRSLELITDALLGISMLCLAKKWC